jgi:hypothetical protein
MHLIKGSLLTAAFSYELREIGKFAARATREPRAA